MEFFTDCNDLDRLVPYLQSQGNYNNNNEDEISSDLHYDEDNYADDPEYQLARKIKFSSPFFRKHERLHKLMAEVVEDFGLISFLPLDISSAESVGRVLSKIDKSNGYIFTQHSTSKSPTTKAEDIFQVAMQSDSSNYETIADIQERISIGKEQQHNQEEKQC